MRSDMSSTNAPGQLLDGRAGVAKNAGLNYSRDSLWSVHGISDQARFRLAFVDSRPDLSYS